jgi:hypothetical protein
MELAIWKNILIILRLQLYFYTVYQEMIYHAFYYLNKPSQPLNHTELKQ